MSLALQEAAENTFRIIYETVRAIKMADQIICQTEEDQRHIYAFLNAVDMMESDQCDLNLVCAIEAFQELYNRLIDERVKVIVMVQGGVQ